MTPNLAQVLNTLAHEIRTPLAVSQGYLKLYLDGRLTNVDDTRKAFEQTRQALGMLSTLCADMSRVSALSEATATGVPERVSAAAFMTNLQAHTELDGAAWSVTADRGTIESGNHRDLAQAIAIVTKAAFDESRASPHAVRADAGRDLVLVAGNTDALEALEAGPDAPDARTVDFVKGGKGLRLIWAAFVLDTHHVQTWTAANHRASVGFRIPLVSA
ncbi:MAG TPA: histidine kinase dimerization/phospho-acceptor domain-containing protein [Vicinamibacterales bacterium]|jgi:signal transduction histidine kinase